MKTLITFKKLTAALLIGVVFGAYIENIPVHLTQPSGTSFDCFLTGDEFYVMDSEQEAKKIASRRGQLQRAQSLRTQKHLTLDEIGYFIFRIKNQDEVNLVSIEIENLRSI